MIYTVHVRVTIKENVIDPQGTATLKSLHSLNFNEVQEVRIGKFIKLHVEAASAAAARERAEEMCQKLLVNHVVEEYHLDVVEGNEARAEG